MKMPFYMGVWCEETGSILPRFVSKALRIGKGLESNKKKKKKSFAGWVIRKSSKEENGSSIQIALHRNINAKGGVRIDMV